MFSELCKFSKLVIHLNSYSIDLGRDSVKYCDQIYQVYVNIVMPQFDWLCDVYGWVMSPTLGIYYVDLSFINNYKKPQL